jgi:hypothetical protein
LQVDYRLARRLDDKPEKFTPPQSLSKTLGKLRDRIRAGHAGTVQIKPHGRSDWSAELTVRQALDRLEDRFTSARENDDLDTWLCKAKQTGAVWVVQEEGYPEDAVDLPAGASTWPLVTQDWYRFTFTPGRFKSGRPSYLGVFNCRMTRQGGSYSYHAWAQAGDAGIARPDGSYNHALADEMKFQTTREFGQSLMYIVTYREDPALHGNHNHSQFKPDRSGQTPPCFAR